MLPTQSSALLVIDVQDTFKLPARWKHRNNPGFEANVTALIDAFRGAGAPIFFFLHSDDDPGWRTTDPGYKLMDFVPRLPGDPLLHKTSRNCFTSTNLQQLLVKAGVKRLAISGIQTEQCCETTARVAADLGYDVDFVTDATLTFPAPLRAGEWDSADALDAGSIVERTEYALRHRFARIASTAELVRELASQAACVA